MVGFVCCSMSGYCCLGSRSLNIVSNFYLSIFLSFFFFSFPFSRKCVSVCVARRKSLEVNEVRKTEKKKLQTRKIERDRETERQRGEARRVLYV